MDRHFDYRHSLPYELPSEEAAQAELDTIVASLTALHAAGAFQHYTYGTAYALDVWRELRRLHAWLRRKHEMPLATRIHLTQLFAGACLEAVEPVLVVRYGAAACALWRSRRLVPELHRLRGIIDWSRLVRCVRNLVLLSPGAKTEQIHGRLLEHRVNYAFGDMVKLGSPAKVVLALARRFQCTVEATDELRRQISSDVLSFLGPKSHDPSDMLVMEAWTALVPLGGDVDIAELFAVRTQVQDTLFYQCIVPVLAEVAFLRLTRGTDVDAKDTSNATKDTTKDTTNTNDTNDEVSDADRDDNTSEIVPGTALTADQWDLCFQAALHSWDIPLMSSQASKAKSAQLQPAPTLAMSGPSARQLLKKQGYNSKAHLVNGHCFAKLVVSSLNDASSDRLLTRLDALFNAVITFCHPSNSGAWSILIASTVKALVQTMSMRVYQRHDVPTSTLERFVAVLRPAVLMSVQSSIKFVSSVSLDVLSYLALMSPRLVVPGLLGEIYPALQHGLHQSHRLANSIAVLERMTLALREPAFRLHATTLLELALPSLDTNDTRRCTLTLELFQAAASVGVFEDVSDGQSVAVAQQVMLAAVGALEAVATTSTSTSTSAVPVDVMADLGLDDATLALAVQGTSAAYPEIISSYMRRVFGLLEFTSEQSLSSAAASSVLRVLLACAPPIFDRALDIAVEEVSNPQQLNHDAFAQVCGSFVRANCRRAFPRLWRVVVANIRHEITENAAGNGRVAMAKDGSLLRNLSVLNMCLLACNPKLLLGVVPELRALLRLLRERTGVSVVYTVANTLHHAVAGLVSYVVVLPPPAAFAHTYADCGGDVSTVTADYANLKWNVPTDATRQAAIAIFSEQIEMSQRVIGDGPDENAEDNNAMEVSMESSDESESGRSSGGSDAVTNALIFVRTAIGAIAVLADDARVAAVRASILRMLARLYARLGKDDIAQLKEVLFVAKVWLCDVRYERSSRLDQHQATLYSYEKHQFAIKGAGKTVLPPALLARRAQYYHHQLLAQASEHRAVRPEEEELVLTMLVDACFSVYPAVRRNAFSALYSPLKIFNDPQLYTRVYERVLAQLEPAIAAAEFEKAAAGMALLRYRSFSVHTASRNPQLVQRFYEVCCAAAAAEYKQLSTVATLVYFTTLPDVAKLGTWGEASEASSETPSEGADGTPTANEADTTSQPASYLRTLVQSLLVRPVAHWRDNLFRNATLLAISQNRAFEGHEDILGLFIEESRSTHPEVRNFSTLGVLNVLQAVFRHRLLPHRSLASLHADADLETPGGFSEDAARLENDWPGFYTRAFAQVADVSKHQLMNTYFVAMAGSQGWAVVPERGLARAPTAAPDLRRLIRQPELARKLDAGLGGLFDQLVGLRQLEPRPEQDNVNHVFTVYFRDLVVLAANIDTTSLNDAAVNDEAAASAKAVLDAGVVRQDAGDDASDKNWHRVAAEVLCGQWLAMPVLEPAAAARVLRSGLAIFGDAVDRLSPATLKYWLSALSHAFSQVDHRRLAPLLEFVEQRAAPSAQDSGGIKLSMRMALYTEVLATLAWRQAALPGLVGRWESWNHELQTVRESAGDELSVAAFAAARPEPRSPGSGIQLGAENSAALLGVFARRKEVDMSKAQLSLLHLLHRLLQILGGDAIVELLLAHGLPLLLECSAYRDDPEIITLVNNIFLDLGAQHFRPASARRVAKFFVQALAERHSSQWHQGIRLLLSLQPLYFNHLMVLGADVRRAVTFAVVDVLGGKVEVSDLAADTLSGIVRVSPPAEQQALIKQLLGTYDAENGDALYKQPGMCYVPVLCLGALVGAFPYTSPPPPWIPSALAILAMHAAGRAGVVSKSAKRILSDFKKTRQDTWHIDQTVFTQDQLDDLDGMLWRNYFA